VSELDAQSGSVLRTIRVSKTLSPVLVAVDSQASRVVVAGFGTAGSAAGTVIVLNDAG